MIIIGINAYHGDSSACLIKDGVLVSAVEEERFRREKHWAGFPSESIKYCLNKSGIKLSDVQHFAINQNPKSNFWKKIRFGLSKRPELSMVIDRLKLKNRRANVANELLHSVGSGFQGIVHNVDHHLSHLSSAFHVSPFQSAVVLSIDGFGDFASTAWGIGDGKNINIDNQIYFPHSLGIFYQALTQWLGFPKYGDEYKVMGLAPYGSEIFIDKMSQIVNLKNDGSFELNLNYFQHHNQKIQYETLHGEPKVGKLYSQKLIDLLGPARNPNDELTQYQKDIARSVQAMYEKAFFHLLNSLYKKFNNQNLCLAGGCAMNSVANGKIHLKTPFKKIYIQSAAGDAGGAIGAAFSTWHKLGGERHFVMDHSYWGPEFLNEDLGQLISAKIDIFKEKKCIFSYIEDEKSLCDITAKAISEGNVIGWFQGPMEWGPRALGNRSILSDPRRPDMKNILNLKIKRRENFRPFAPSILQENVNEWFEHDYEVPFMMQVYPIRKEKQSLIPAVTHVDGSGRLQTVIKKNNPRYHRLISSFADLTGVPILLNTSFNENEPVVCKPEEALDCFLRTKMDVLVLGNWLIRREK